MQPRLLLCAVNALARVDGMKFADARAAGLGVEELEEPGSGIKSGVTAGSVLG